MNTINDFNEAGLSVDAYKTKVGNLDKSLYDYFQTTKAGEASSEGYAKSLVRPTTALGRFGAAIGKTVLTMGTMIAVEKGIELVAEAWQNYSQRQEKAIEKGDNALATHQKNLKEYSNATKLVEDSGERFLKLQEGVQNGINLNLSTDEFKEYQDLASQVAQLLPNLVSGYDTLGNPIINAVSNIEQLNEALQTQQKLISQDNVNKARDYAEAFNAKNNHKAFTMADEAGYEQQEETLEKLLKLQKSGKLDKAALGARGMVGQSLSEADTKSWLSTADVHTIRQISDELGIEDVYSRITGINTKVLDENIDAYRDYLSNVQSSRDESFRDTKPFIESVLSDDENNLKYNNLSDETKNALSSIINSMDYLDAKEVGFVDEAGDLSTKAIKKWGNNVVGELQNSKVQDSLTDMFALEDQKGSMTLSEYRQSFNDLADTVTSRAPSIQKAQLKAMTGYDDTLTDLEAYQNALLKAGMDYNDVKTLTNDELGFVWKLSAEDDFSPVWSDVQKKLAQAKQEQKRWDELNGTEAYDAWTKAQETPNQGYKYDAMHGNLEAAKKAYDEGLTGTDDFKSFAALISPTGSSDPVNFLENYGKAARYLTEDKTGVNNFLSDLSQRTNDAGEAFASFDSATGKWAFNIQDMSEAADKMGISTEFMMANFNKAKEYGIDNNFVSSQEEGAERIKSLQKDLIESERELAEMLTPGDYDTTDGMTKGNQTAIDQKRAHIEDLKESIRGTSQYIKDMSDAWAQEALDERNAAKSSINTLADERNKILQDQSLSGDEKNYLTKGIEDAIKETAGEYDLELTSDLHVNTDGTEGLEQLKAEAEVAQQSLNKLTDKTYEFNFDSTDVNDLNGQIDQANQQLAQFRNSDGTINFDTQGAKEAVKVLETLVRQREQIGTEKAPIMGAETDSSKAASGLQGREAGQATQAANMAKAAQNYLNAKDAFDTANQMNLQGANNDMQQYTSNAREAAKSLQNIVSQPGLESIAQKLDFSNIDTTEGLSNLETQLKSLTPDELDAINVKLKGDTSELTSDIGETQNEIPFKVRLDDDSLTALGAKPFEVHAKLVPEQGKVSLFDDYINGKNAPEIPVTPKITNQAHEAVKRDFGLPDDNGAQYAQNMANASKSAEQTQQATSGTSENLVAMKMGIGPDWSQMASGIGDAFSTVGNFFSSLGEGKDVTATVNTEVEGEEQLDEATSKIEAADGKTATQKLQSEVEGEEQLDESTNKLDSANGKTATQTLQSQARGQEQIEQATQTLESAPDQKTSLLDVEATGADQVAQVTDQLNSAPESTTINVDTKVEPPEVPDVSGETVKYTAEVEKPDIPVLNGKVKYTADTSGVDMYQPSPIEATVNYVVNNPAPPEYPDQNPEVIYQITAPPAPVYPDQNPSVTYSISAPPAPFYPNMSRTVTYTVIPAGGTPAVNGTAHAQGTAFADGSTDDELKKKTKGLYPIPQLSARAAAWGSLEDHGRRNTNTALAHGDWGVKKSQVALTGELGQELVVKYMPPLHSDVQTKILSNCWKTLKTIKLQRSHEIRASVNVAKAERIYCMV